jgi:hypothetical protein
LWLLLCDLYGSGQKKKWVGHCDVGFGDRVWRHYATDQRIIRSITRESKRPAHPGGLVQSSASQPEIPLVT